MTTATAEKITRNQEKQEAFLNKLGERMWSVAVRYGGYEPLLHISLTCKTCRDNNHKTCPWHWNANGVDQHEDDCNEASLELHTVDGALQWLGRHQGHDTWVEYIGATK